MAPKVSISSFAILVESYLFPFLFGYYAFKSCRFLCLNYRIILEIVHRIRVGGVHLQYIGLISDILYSALLMLFNILIIWALLTRKNLYEKPEGFLELFLPLAGTFFYLSYNFLQYIPKKWNIVLVPQNSLLHLSAIGSFVSVGGLVIACLGTYDLRRSYGVFVQVRQIITERTYRHVRHPIYSGYILILIGFLLIVPKCYNFILTVTAIWITILRAIIEEKKLAAFSPGYREYMSRTPMIFPITLNRKREP